MKTSRMNIAPLVYHGAEEAKPRPEKIDLTGIAESLDAHLLLQLAGAEAMRGSGKKEAPLEFQSLLTALALKGGLAHAARKHLVEDVPHLKTEEEIEAAQQFQKQYLLARNAGIQTAHCVVEALKGTIDPARNDRGELGERGLFSSRKTLLYGRAATQPSSLVQSLDEYGKTYPDLELRTAHRLLEEFQRTIKKETDKSFQLLQEERKETQALPADVVPIQNRILGPLAEVLRKKADRPKSGGDSIGVDHVAHK